jgi:serine/threonine protein kinase
MDDDATVRLDSTVKTDDLGDIGSSLISGDKKAEELFIMGQSVELNGKKYLIEGAICKGSGEALLYKISMGGKPYVLKHYKRETPLRNAAKDVLRKIKDNPKDRIVKVYDFGQHHDQDFEIMEYAEGGTLYEYLEEKGPINDPDQKVLKNLVKQINEGLEQLHDELNIIYQDLKPKNIYFRDKNKTSIILADFGISSLLKPGEKTAQVETNATEVYAAPDLARIGDQKYVEAGPPVDYFALGITMLHLWLGVTPFQGISESKRAQQIRDKEVILPLTMPEDCKALIQGLIDPLPKTRWGNQHIKKWVTECCPSQEEPTANMNHELLNIVRQIITEQGDSILGDPKRVSAFFSDMARDVPKLQKNVFLKCLEHKFAQILKDAAEQDRAGIKQRLAERLREEEGFELKLCVETVDLLETAIHF